MKPLDDKKKVWFAVGAIVLIAVIVFGAFVVGKNLGGGNDETSNDSSASAPTNQDSSAGEGTNNGNGEAAEDKFGQSDADIFGRNIKVPKNGVGVPLTKEAPDTNSTCDVKDKQPATIQVSHSMQTLWSEKAGPSNVDDSVPAGYAHSPEGAMMAAWNGNALQYHGGDTLKPVLEKLFTGPNATQKLESIPAGPIPSMGSTTEMQAPSAFRITSCNEERVIGDIAMPMPTDSEGNPDKKAWGVIRVSAVWEDGDWKAELDEVEQPIEDEVSNLDGWSQWTF